MLHGLYKGKISMHRTVMRLALVFMLFVPIAGYPGSFKVTPIKVYLEGDNKVTAIHVVNEGEESVTVQLEAMEWSQDEQGVDQYVTTKDLVIFPKIVSLGKAEDRIIRLGYQGRPAIARERTYRVYIQELPIQTPGQTGVVMATRFGVPVFIRPTQVTQEQEIQAVRMTAQGLHITIRNTGTQHVITTGITAIGLNETDAEVFMKSATGWYVLPGVARTFVLPVSQEECHSIRRVRVAVKVAGKVDIATLESTRAIDAPQCSSPTGESVTK